MTPEPGLTPEPEPEENEEVTLLDEVKEELRIEWNDEDARLSRIIDRGKGRLSALVGTELQFEGEGLAKDLLLAYCRYAYNNALEYYEENFQAEILRLQLEFATEDYKESPDSGGDE